MGLCLKILFILVLSLSVNLKILIAHSRGMSAGEYEWVDSILTSMSLDQKIGQLMMIATYSNLNETHYRNVELLIERYHIGGLVFFQGSPSKQLELTNRYQRLADVPILIGMDAEWGVSMRLDSILPFPRPMTLGAIEDDRYLYNYGAEIARQCRLMGVHVNFAPVLDVNNNASNPVINVRSFGEITDWVAAKGVSYFQGLQDNGIIGVGKHFPGHGDTDIDSHHALPVIRHPIKHLDSIELVPFKKAVREGIKGIMVAHLNIPALDNDWKRPASLSGNIIQNILRSEFHFNGLVFTDAMNMQGVTSVFPSGRAELEAFKAGCDVLLMPVNVPAVVDVFKKGIETGEITEKMIDEKVVRLLKAKYEAGLHTMQYSEPRSLVQRLNKNAESLNQKVYEQAITLIRNLDSLVPFHLIDTIRFASLVMNGRTNKETKTAFDNYIPMDHFSLKRKMDKDSDYLRILNELKSYEIVIVSLHGLSTRAKNNFGIYPEDVDFIQKLNKLTKVVLVVYGIPYSLKNFINLDHLICAYEDNFYSQSVVPQLLFGALPFKGHLPVGINEEIKAGHGLSTKSLGRLGLSTLEAEGFQTDYIKLIDSIVTESIQEESIPGCQVLIARNGRIVFNRNYGYQTYDSLIPIQDNSVYDLASVTKVAGSLQALMMLYEFGLLDLDKKVSFYLPGLKNTNKEDIVLRDLLTHQAGLLPYYPFWIYTLKKYNSENNYYSKTNSFDYPLEITRDMYAKSFLKDTLWNWMLRTELLEKEDPDKPHVYKYSDMGFYIIQQLVEGITGWPLDQYLDKYFYEPLGLTHLTYLPNKKFDPQWIVPSGIDKLFRNGKIQGYVHDEIAAIYGGVAGHAGLFSNALELAKIMQMNLQGGYYGGIQYFQPETIFEFTSRQYKKNRRGIGWDKPQLIGDEYNPASFYASPESYGHSGFTGTYVWVDPKYNLIYVFLSNRTYPDTDNRKLIDQDTRKRIQTVIYSSIINFKK